MSSIAKLEHIQSSGSSSIDVAALAARCNKAMEDDMNTAKLVGHLLSGTTQINNLVEGQETISEADLETLKKLYHDWVFSVLGLEKPEVSGNANEITGDLIEMVLQLRNDAKTGRDFETADRIRNELTKLGITVKDRKDGADWEIN
jgi:cysteinyl-tRNA synthetase